MVGKPEKTWCLSTKDPGLVAAFSAAMASQTSIGINGSKYTVTFLAVEAAPIGKRAGRDCFITLSLGE